jgi:hypothetical protein
MAENWKPIAGFEGRYEVSGMGRVRAVSFPQRYLLRNGLEAYRRTKPRAVSQQRINSGYLIAHLHLDGKRKALLVHRLVAAAFCPGFADSAEVNHLNGLKRDNRAANLEGVTRTANHLHAVRTGLRPQAIRVRCPATGEVFDSITQAARARKIRVGTVRAKWERAA